MAFVAVGVAVAGTVAAGAVSASSAKSAAKAQEAGAMSAQQLQYTEFQQEQQNEQPWMSAGNTALQALSSGFGANGAFTQNFTQADLQNSPGYQYQLSQGQNATKAAAAASGMSLSPATQEALNSNAQGLAASNFQQEYSDYNTNMNRQISGDETIAGIGENAVAGVNSAGQNYANQASSDVMAGANAQAAGDVAVGNAESKTISGVTSDLVSGYSAGAFNSPSTSTTTSSSPNYYAGLNDPNYFSAGAQEVGIQQQAMPYGYSASQVPMSDGLTVPTS